MESDLDALVGLAYIDDIQLDNQINGLGALVKAPFTHAQKQGVKNLVKSKANEALVQSSATRSSRFLLSQAHKLDDQSAGDLKTGRSRLITRDYYFRRKITLAVASTYDLLKVSDIAAVGTQNLDKNFLPPGENFAVDRIKFSYGADIAGSVTAVDGVVYTNATESMFGVGSTTTDMGSDAQLTTKITQPLVDPVFLNGELKLFLDGGEVLSLPVKKFFKDRFSVAAGVEGGQDCVHLESPILIKAGQRIEARLYTAVGGTIIATRTNFCELRLMGAATAPRAAN